MLKGSHFDLGIAVPQSKESLIEICRFLTSQYIAALRLKKNKPTFSMNVGQRQRDSHVAVID